MDNTSKMSTKIVTEQNIDFIRKRVQEKEQSRNDKFLLPSFKEFSSAIVSRVCAFFEIWRPIEKKLSQDVQNQKWTISRNLSEDKIDKQIKMMESKYQNDQEDQGVTSSPDTLTTGFFEDVAIIQLLLQSNP